MVRGLNHVTERSARELPGPVVRRLPKYLTLVQHLREGGVEWVSSADVARALGLTGSTVRQDLSHLKVSGLSRRGYRVAELERVLARVLGADRTWKVVIVGAGNLGQALAKHGDLQRHGFEICGIFDVDRRVIGRKVGALKVMAFSEVDRVVKERGVRLGIIAVPAWAAQEVADRLVAAGIKGILNLAYANVLVRPGVAVVNARILESLQELVYMVRLGVADRGERR